MKKNYENLEKKVKEYFEYCDQKNIEHQKNSKDKQHIVKPYTMSGLMSYLGITRLEFEKLICHKKYEFLLSAKMRIEAFIEENSLNGSLSCNASANSLKYNFGWGEKTMAQEDTAGQSISISLEGEALRFAR